MSNIVIRGSGGSKGGGGGGGVESPDSLRSNQIARYIDALGEGEIVGLVNGKRSIYLNDTPLENADGSQNFGGVELQWRWGAINQTAMDGFTDVETETSVGVEVKKALPITRTLANLACDTVRVTVGVNGLMENDDQGNIKAASVEYTIEVQSNGGGFKPAVTDTIEGKTGSRYRRAHRIKLAGAGPWDIRVTRVTADSTSQKLQNALHFDSYTGIISSRVAYVHTAAVGIAINAQQLPSVPSRAYHVKGLLVQVPSNYDPIARTYTGLWNGAFKLAWTNNPAWVLYDILTSERYGVGQHIDPASVDKWSLYQAARYNDQLVPDGMGGTEPRFTCNLVLQERADAFRVAQDVAGIMRAAVYWGPAGISVVQDRPSDPVQLYTNANVIHGEFVYAGTSLKARHTAALVAWNDPSDLFHQKLEYVQDDEGVRAWGVIQREVTALGCSSRGQATRLGRWVLDTERLEDETITFKTGYEGATLYPGAVVQVSDASRTMARFGGRVVSGTSTRVTLDASVTLKAGVAYKLILTLPDGKPQTRAITTPAGSVSAVNVSPAFDVAPVPDAVYSIVEGLLEPEQWRIVSVAEEDDGAISVAGVKHHPGKYDAIEQGFKLDPLPISNLKARPSAPENLTLLTASKMLDGDVASITGTLSWTGAAQGYQVRWRFGAEAWQEASVTDASMDIPGLQVGAYQFQVVAVNAMGLTSQAAVLTHTVTPQPVALPAVTGLGFEGGAYAGQDAKFKWSKVAGATSYEVRVMTGATVRRTVNVGDALRFNYTASDMRVDGGPWRSVTVSVRALGKWGGASPWASTTASNPQAAPLTAIKIEPGIKSGFFSAQMPAEDDIAGLLVWIGTSASVTPTADNLVYDGLPGLVTISALKNGAPLVGNQTYYVRAAAYDTFGRDALNVSTAVSFVPWDVNQMVTELAESQLNQSLRTRISLIDAPGTGLVDKVGDLQVTYGNTASSAASAAAAAQSASDAITAKAAAIAAQSGAETASSTSAEKALAASQSAASAAQAKADALLAKSGAETAKAAATTAKTNAETAASNASVSAGNAAASATSAAGSASTASSNATTAANAATTAGQKADAASTSATNAAASATAAGQSATSSASSATAASTSAGSAKTYRDEAATSATTAGTKAGEAASSANSASTSAGTAAQSATNAGNSASAAATSASTASTKATEASQSATSANSSKTAAATSASQAGTSATQAASSATTAGTKAGEAATSASAAAGSATTASTKAGEASTSASQAASSATSAAGSATQAGTSATTAANSATQSGNSANAAQQSATNAATYATNAETAATSSQSSRVAAEAAYQGSVRLNGNADFSLGKDGWSSNSDTLSTPAGTIVSDSVTGGAAWQAVGNATIYGSRRPVQEGRVYRVRARVKATGTAPSTLYAGAANYDASGARLGGGTHRYCAASGVSVPNDGEWRVYEGTITHGGAGANRFFAGTAFAAPLVLANYQQGANRTLITDELSFEDITESTEAAKQAAAAATSASTAASKATEAGQSATSASTSANTASTKAGEAGVSATQAASSATAADGSAQSAATSLTQIRAHAGAGMSDSLNADPGCVDPALWSHPARLVPVAGSVAGRKAYRVTGPLYPLLDEARIPVRPGETYEISIGARSLKGGSNLWLIVRAYAADGSDIFNGDISWSYPIGAGAGGHYIQSTWAQRSYRFATSGGSGGRFTLPAGVAYIRLCLAANHKNDATQWLEFELPSIKRVTDTVLGEGNTASISALSQTVADNQSATAQQINTISATVDANKIAAELAKASESGGVLRVAAPEIGAFSQSSPAVTGAIKITLPQYRTNTMLSFRVDIFDYAAGAAITYEIAGYTHKSGWINCTAVAVGSAARTKTVRFGHDGSKCCIWIGETNSTWSYPKVRVYDFIAGHDNFTAARWATGWEVGIATGFNTIEATIDTANAEKSAAAAMAAVQTEATARAAADGHLYAQYTIKLQSGKYAASIGLASESPVHSAGGSKIIMLADQFGVGSPGRADQFPFVIDTILNRIGINGNLLVSGSVTATALAADSVTATQLKSASVETVHFNGKVVKAWNIDVVNLSAINAVLGNVHTGSIRGGNYASWAWPSSGSGFYLGPEGIRLGREASGNFFEVTAAGSVKAPGLTVDNGKLTINELNVIKSANIQDNDITNGGVVVRSVLQNYNNQAYLTHNIYVKKASMLLIDVYAKTYNGENLPIYVYVNEALIFTFYPDKYLYQGGYNDPIGMGKYYEGSGMGVIDIPGGVSTIKLLVRGSNPNITPHQIHIVEGKIKYMGVIR